MKKVCWNFVVVVVELSDDDIVANESMAIIEVLMEEMVLELMTSYVIEDLVVKVVEVEEEAVELLVIVDMRLKVSLI